MPPVLSSLLTTTSLPSVISGTSLFVAASYLTFTTMLRGDVSYATSGFWVSVSFTVKVKFFPANASSFVRTRVVPSALSGSRVNFSVSNLTVPSLPLVFFCVAMPLPSRENSKSSFLSSTLPLGDMEDSTMTDPTINSFVMLRSTSPSGGIRGLVMVTFAVSPTVPVSGETAMLSTSK